MLLIISLVPLSLSVVSDPHVDVFVLETYVNGELDSRKNGGFKKIFMHFQNDHHVEVYPNKVTVRAGQTVTHHTGQDFITAGR